MLRPNTAGARYTSPVHIMCRGMLRPNTTRAIPRSAGHDDLARRYHMLRPDTARAIPRSAGHVHTNKKQGRGTPRPLIHSPRPLIHTSPEDITYCGPYGRGMRRPKHRSSRRHRRRRSHRHHSTRRCPNRRHCLRFDCRC